MNINQLEPRGNVFRAAKTDGRDKRLVGDLITLMNRPDIAYFDGEIVLLLGKLGGEGTARFLARNLRDRLMATSPKLAKTCLMALLFALTSIGGETAISSILEVMEHGDKDISLFAARALVILFRDNLEVCTKEEAEKILVLNSKLSRMYGVRRYLRKTILQLTLAIGLAVSYYYDMKLGVIRKMEHPPI